MAAFTVYDGLDDAALVDALLAPASGIAVSNIALQASASDAVNYYDGSIAPLGIGAGLLLTSGTTPGTSNTVGWFGQDNSGTSGFSNGDADIDAVVNTVFQTQSYDATTLSFDFTVADPTATSISFDLVFGSDEFPEWVDQFVDSAIVMVNGVNYALFNHDPQHPLSVVSGNLAAGYFQDNAGNTFGIEYDGVSQVLKIIAPIIPGGGTNHIKIGIADTGDHIYDSGVFLSNFAAGNAPGSGVVVTPPAVCTEGDDTISGSSKAEFIDLKGGDDVFYAGGGDDIVVAGSGNDTVFGGSGADELKGDAGDDYLDGGANDDTAVYAGASTDYTIGVVSGGLTITDIGAGSEGTDTLVSIEYVKFSDGLFAIDAGGVLSAVADPGAAPSNTPGSVVISGLGTAGSTLTANVSDANGIPGAISYQWQVSANDGASWSDVGTDASTYVVDNADVGMLIQVIASYTDGASNAEDPVSVAKAIQQVGDGDLVVSLIHLDAPDGASVIDPLTTLVKAAIDFGLTPNAAVQAVMTVLGLPESVDLLDYDAYAALQSDPGDAVGLAVEKVAVQIAVLTSLSDDDSGTNLTLSILQAAQNGDTLNLADAHDLAGIIGVDITGITDKKLYPEPLKEIFDRNDNIDQAADVSDIEAEWQDFLSIQDGVNSTSIADLVIHVNQDPTGSATASLANGLAGTTYVVSADDLLAGFSDYDGDTLAVDGLSADSGAVTDNGDDTFSIINAAGFTGPVELTYSVIDGQGGSAQASQLFAILAPGVTAGDDDVSGTQGDDSIDGLTGNDILNGLDGDDTLSGGKGDDHLCGGAGNDVLNGGKGSDWAMYDDASGGILLKLSKSGFQEIGGGAGSDQLISIENAEGSQFDDVVKGSKFDNTLLGGDGADKLVGRGGNDDIWGGAGKDRISGSSGNDLLHGEAGNDKLNGGGGNDTIDGGTGNDYELGGGGADTFVFATGDGHDTIQDFAVGVDTLDISGIPEIADFADLVANHAVDTLAGMEIAYGANDVITLLGVHTADLDAGDFVF